VPYFFASGIGDKVLKTSEEWFAIGREEGIRAGGSEMSYQARDFGPREDALASGHALFDGEYALITRSYGDFANHDLCGSWMAGVIEGCTSVGARLGFTTGTPDIASGRADAVRLHLMIVKDVAPADVALN